MHRINRRQFIRVSSAAGAGLVAGTTLAGAGLPSSALSTESPSSTHWWKRRNTIYWYDQYALNEHALAFSRYDPDRIANELESTGADIIAVYAANQFSVAYYPSTVWPQHPNLRGRDYFGELATRLRARGKKVLAYINWLESRHPEWSVVPLDPASPAACVVSPLANWADPSDPEKRVEAIPGGHWRFPCINSPRREQVKAVAREIVERYHPDAFHLDMFHSTVDICLCPYCRPSIEKLCGSATITRESIKAHWKEYIDWRCRCSASLLEEIYPILKDNGVIAAHNACLPMGRTVMYAYSEEWLPYIDVYVSEIFSDIHDASMSARWHNAINKPSWQLMTSTAASHPHLTIPLARWKAAAATCKANGGAVFGPCGVGAFPDTTTAPELLETVRLGLRSYMEDADLADGARSAAKVAVMFSWATRKYLREGGVGWSDEISGWSHLLIERHIPFDYVIAENVTAADQLSSYDVVVLPTISHIEDTLAMAITGYVQKGGHVLVTGETSLYDSKTGKRGDFALAETLGVRWVGAFEGPFAFTTSRGAQPAAGIFQQTRAIGKVLSTQVAVDPAGSVAGGLDPLPTLQTQWPAAVANDCGQGKAVYVAFDIGRYYQQWRFVHAGAFMAEMVDSLLPSPQIAVSAPGCVEVTVWEQPHLSRTIIHLANRTQRPADLNTMNELVPVHDIGLRIKNSVSNPDISCRGGAIETTSEGGVVSVRLACLDAYAAIVIEPARAG